MIGRSAESAALRAGQSAANQLPTMAWNEPSRSESATSSKRRARDAKVVEAGGAGRPESCPGPIGTEVIQVGHEVRPGQHGLGHAHHRFARRQAPATGLQLPHVVVDGGHHGEHPVHLSGEDQAGSCGDARVVVAHHDGGPGMA